MTSIAASVSAAIPRHCLRVDLFIFTVRHGRRSPLFRPVAVEIEILVADASQPSYRGRFLGNVIPNVNYNVDGCVDTKCGTRKYFCSILLATPFETMLYRTRIYLRTLEY